jgi:hypothetical protein
LGPFQVSTKIQEDIYNFVIIADVNYTGDELFTGVNNNGDKVITGVVLRTIDYNWCH